MKMLVLQILVMLLAVVAQAQQNIPASFLKLYQQTTGTIFIAKKNPELTQKWLDLWNKNDRATLVREWLNSGEFQNANLRTFVSQYSNEENDIFSALDDYQILLLLGIRQNIDLRKLVYGDYVVQTDKNSQYVDFFPAAIADSTLRTSVSNLPINNKSTAGLFTTSGFARRFLSAGTNRRAIRGLFNIFLCTPIEKWKDASLDEFYIGKDVDRGATASQPISDAFRTNCRACHAPMDSMRGAFAYMDFTNGLVFSKNVHPKYNQNATVYPQGQFETTSDEWQNLLITLDHQKYFGWRNNDDEFYEVGEYIGGSGVRSFAKTIAYSERFQKCAVDRAIRLFCPETAIDDITSVQSPLHKEYIALVNKFRDNSYQTLDMFQNVINSSICRW